MAEYVITAEGKMCAENGYVAIDDLTICKEAAAQLIYKFQKTETFKNWPKGCFEYDGHVYFNEHVYGTMEYMSTSRQICKERDSELRSFLTSMHLLV